MPGLKTWDSPNGKDMTIFVCVHPKARPDGYIGPELDYRRMKSIASQIKGSPVRDNHCQGNIGVNMSGTIDGERQLWATMRVPRESSVGRAVRANEYRAASLGLQHEVVMKPGTTVKPGEAPNWNDVERIKGTTLEEISVCPRGKSKHTWIASYFSDHPNIMNADGRTARFYSPLVTALEEKIIPFPVAQIDKIKNQDKLAGETYVSISRLAYLCQGRDSSIIGNNNQKVLFFSFNLKPKKTIYF